jgi:cytochrome c-type biogenesis protein CcmH
MHILLLFWLAALAIVAAALAALVAPLLRRRAANATDTPAAAIYRDEKRQLDDELAAGAITAPEHAQAIDELASRLAGELQAAPRAERLHAPRAGWRWALGLALAFPVVAVGLYALLGNPQALREESAAAKAPAMSKAQVTAMVDRLATRMKEHPDDATGWKLLGRSYGALGRYREAADAFHQAAQHGAVDADLLVDWADALGMANGQTLAGEPTRLVERALALEPGNVNALLLAASAAQERNDIPAAIDLWRRLKVELPPGSPEVQEIDALIARAEAAGQAPGGAPREAASSGNGAIRGEVTIAPALATRVAPGDTLFIYARAVDGPRMPVAVLREGAAPLPRAFTLDDSQSMRPDAKLSTAGKVIVEARISRSGDALPAPGDLVGSSVPVTPGARQVAVVIGDIVK